jgi:insertion element IS1 protein InsB
MPFIPVQRPYCHSDQVITRDKTRRGSLRSLCQHAACAPRSFLLKYSDRGRLPEVKQQIIAMSLNASGVRATARVLCISTDIVPRARRKKKAALALANTARVRTVDPDAACPWPL